MEKEFFIWLILEKDANDKLAGIISALSKNYNSPEFNPHITLLSGINEPREEAIAKTGKISSLFKDLEVELSKIEFTDEYFRCLFLKVEENKKLNDLRNRAVEIFGLGKEEYYPHVSLMYGNFDKSVKTEIIRELGSLRIKSRTSKVQLLERDRGEKAKWRIVKEFKI